MSDGVCGLHVVLLVVLGFAAAVLLLLCVVFLGCVVYFRQKARRLDKELFVKKAKDRRLELPFDMFHAKDVVVPKKEEATIELKDVSKALRSPLCVSALKSTTNSPPCVPALKSTTIESLKEYEKEKSPLPSKA